MIASGGEGDVGEEKLAALLEAPATAKDDIGVRLAIMQRLLGLRCTESLVADANAALDADLEALVGRDPGGGIKGGHQPRSLALTFSYKTSYDFSHFSPLRSDSTFRVRRSLQYTFIRSNKHPFPRE